MPYLSLYRKYRPQRFADVCGQEHVTRTLQNAIVAGHVAHAYLFCGPRGTGKTTTARLLAKALNCERGPAAEPCNECPACEQVAAGNALDVIEIDAASNRGIEPIRELRDRVHNATAGGRYRVYIVDEVHMLTHEAFNALLKTLEEPPRHVIFVLATTEAHKVPATIASRCQRFDFRRAGEAQLRERLEAVAAQEGATVEPAALTAIARAAAGSWRDALGLLEQVLAYAGERVSAADATAVLGTLAPDALDRLVRALLAGDGATLFGETGALIALGRDPRQLLADLTAHFRDLMLCAAGSCPLARGPEADRLRRQAGQTTLARLVGAVELLAQVDRDLRWSEQPQLLLDLALARLLQHFAAGGSERPAPTVGATAAAPPPARERPSSPAAPPPPAVALESAPPPVAPTADPWDEVEQRVAAPRAASPPRPQGASPPPTPATAPAADVTAIAGRWRVLRQELNRRRNPSLGALLEHARPLALVGGTLYLRFATDVHLELFQSKHAGDLAMLAEAVARVAGVGCTGVRAIGPEAPLPPGVGDAGSVPSPAEPPPSPPQELVHDVVDLFDGQIVTDGDP